MNCCTKPNNFGENVTIKTYGITIINNRLIFDIIIYFYNRNLGNKYYYSIWEAWN